jgi:hypothetical protein
MAGSPLTGWQMFRLLFVLCCIAPGCRPSAEGRPPAASQGTPEPGLVPDLNAFVQGGVPLQGCSPAAAESARGSSARRRTPLAWSAFVTKTASWSLVRPDTAQIDIAYRVVGEIEDKGGGYPSYLIKERIAVDTVRLTATREASGSWRIWCPISSHDYLELSALSDAGLYENASEFTRLVRVGDSIKVAHRAPRTP